MKRGARQQIIKLWIIIAMFLVALPNTSVSAEKIVLVGSENTRASLTGRWLNLIYTEAFRRLGYELEYKAYPNERASHMARNGLVDGEIQRAASYEKIAKNLRKVEEPSFLVNVAAYAVKPGIVLDGWESLKNKDYNVEYRRGSKVAEKALPAVVKPKNLSKISTVESALKKLIVGRTDIFIEQELVVLEALGTLDKDKYDTSSVYQAGIMWSGASYVFLHKKHAELLPKITKVLRAMKQEGLVERYKASAQNSK